MKSKEREEATVGDEDKRNYREERENLLLYVKKLRREKIRNNAVITRLEGEG